MYLKFVWKMRQLIAINCLPQFSYYFFPTLSLFYLQPPTPPVLPIFSRLPRLIHPSVLPISIDDQLSSTIIFLSYLPNSNIQRQHIWAMTNFSCSFSTPTLHPFSISTGSYFTRAFAIKLSFLNLEMFMVDLKFIHFFWWN